MSLYLKIEGDKQLEKILKGLPKAASKRVLNRAFKKAAKPVIASAKAKTPKSSKKTYLSAHRDMKKGVQSTKLVKHRAGELRRSIGFIVAKGPVAGLYIGPRYGSGKANDGWYAHFVEFGTVKQKAKPFMRPAWDQNKRKVEDSITYTVSQEVKKEVLKHARK